mgnify:FL=1
MIKFKIDKLKIAACRNNSKLKIQNSKFDCMFNKILLTSALLAAPIYMSAANDDDDDTSRRWAVIAGMNISSPTTASHEQS